MSIKFKKNIFEHDRKLSDVLSKIGFLSHKIILVTKNKKFIGVLTDGDIRLFFMRNLSKDVLINEIMNYKSVKFLKNYKKDDLLKFHKSNIKYIPIISNQKKIIDLIDLTKIKKKIFPNDVFIIAGGLGSRLYPLTKNTPKPMIKINNKPHLENLIDNLVIDGFINITLCLNYKHEYIINYFNKKKIKANISYSVEKKKLGTAGPIRFSIKKNTNYPIIVLNADLITNLKLSSLINYKKNLQNDLTVCIKEEKYKLPFAIVDSKKEKILSIKEKPENNFYFNTGIYMMNERIIKLIPKNKKYDMPDLIKKSIKNKKKVNAFYIYEKWYDFGTKKTLNILKKN